MNARERRARNRATEREWKEGMESLTIEVFNMFKETGRMIALKTRPGEFRPEKQWIALVRRAEFVTPLYAVKITLSDKTGEYRIVCKDANEQVVTKDHFYPHEVDKFSRMMRERFRFNEGQVKSLIEKLNGGLTTK